MEMYERYNKLAMPNMRLNKEEADVLLAYIDDETQRIMGVPAQADEKPVKAAFTVSSTEPNGDVVAIMNSWVREAHEKATVNAGYMTLVNASDEEVTLLKVDSDAYNKIEVHEMVAVDGVMKMREVKNLVIPAHGQVQMQPGGKHLMLMGPRRHFRHGQQLEFKLVFESGAEQIVSLDVVASDRAE